MHAFIYKYEISAVLANLSLQGLQYDKGTQSPFYREVDSGEQRHS